MEFVNKMRKDGKLIMGVGHRVKSVIYFKREFIFLQIIVDHLQIFLFAFKLNNPDMRVILLLYFKTKITYLCHVLREGGLLRNKKLKLLNGGSRKFNLREDLFSKLIKNFYLKN